MLKLIGAILICGGAAAIGLSLSGRLALRIRVLNSIINALDLMHAEICQFLTPIGELMESLKNTSDAPLSRLFAECVSGMNRSPDVPFAIIWSKAVRGADYLELNSNEKQILIDMGCALGRYDADEQGRCIAHARRTLEGRLCSAEAEKQKAGKLYGGLGIICGIALVIVFI
jgi:stage III sporulation protein AB